MKLINTGEKENSGTGDLITVAAQKINQNFNEVFDKLRIKEPFRIIIWNEMNDTRKAMEDVNYNFKIISEHLSF